MASVKSSKRAFTLIELITVIITASIIMLTAGSIMVSQIIYFRQFMSEVKLQQEAAYIIDSLKNAVAGSEHFNITGASPTQTLETYNRTNDKTDDFTLSGTTLTHNTYYTTAGPGYNKGDRATTEMVSNYIGSLTFSPEPNSSRVLHVDLQTKDPSVTSASGPHIVTALSCRLTPLPPLPPVKSFRAAGGPINYYYTIQSAINAVPNNDCYDICCMGNIGGVFNGTFTENVNISNNRYIVLYGSYDENFTTQKFNGAGATPTTIDGSQSGSVITCSSGSIVYINGFIIQNGKNTYGGGISVSGTGSFNIQNNTIQNNTATVNGGGISFVSPGLSVSDTATSVITSNTITGNSAITGSGGGISFDCSGNGGNFTSIIANNNIVGNSFAYRGGGISIKTTGGWGFGSSAISTIANNIIASNIHNQSLTGSAGGGISSETPSGVTTTIINNNIGKNATNVGNTANCGGGLYCATNTSDYTIRNNNIIGNSATGVDYYLSGGGIYILGGGTNNPATFTIDNNTITNNVASAGITVSQGGGIYIGFSMLGLDCYIRKNMIATNNADSGGGGIWCDYSSSANNYIGRFFIYNNVIAGNKTIKNLNDSTNFGGGGIYYKSAQTNANSYASIINNTVYNNTDASNFGGGIFMSNYQSSVYTYNVINTISWGNIPNNFATTSSLPTNVTYSDIAPLQTGNGNINSSPLFNADYSLGTGSPCIGTGTPPGTDMGAYGGSGGGTVGVQPLPNSDLSGQTYDPQNRIREDILGTY